MKHALATLPLWLLILACSDKPNQNAGVQDFPNTIQASANEALLDLPSSLQNEEASLQAEANTPALAKQSAALTEADPELREAFAAYLAVPVYIHLADAAKQAVQKFIIDLSKQDLPPEWEGRVDSLDVKTSYHDTTINSQKAVFCSLSGKMKGVTIISLQFIRTDSAQYRGRFYLHNPQDHNAKIRVDFNNIASNGEHHMTVTFQRDTINLDKANDPTVIRIHAIKRTNGRLVVTGASYHPTFSDEFWGNKPMVYGFQAVTQPSKDRTVLRVAFAERDSVDSTFFNYHALDKSILRKVTAQMRNNLRDSTGWLKLINFSIDSNYAANTIFTQHFAEYRDYTTDKTPEDFTEADLLEYLELNKKSILNRTDDMGGLRGLYLLVHIKQPIFLLSNATIAGSGPTGAPTGFPLPATAITDEGIENENLAGFESEEIAP